MHKNIYDQCCFVYDFKDEKEYKYSAQPDMDKAPGQKAKKKTKKERKEELEDLKKELEIVSIVLV